MRTGRFVPQKAAQFPAFAEIKQETRLAAMTLNPIVFALRHPITVMVAIAAVVVAGGLAVFRMKIDIFPQLNLPVVYVAQPYGGMDPAQMEGLITNYYEYHFLYISGIHHVESRIFRVRP